jgi:Fic family protein
MELINFEGQLKFYSKTSKKNNKAEAYKAYELTPNADMKISYEILNLDQFNQKFHGDCEKVLPQFTTTKNKKSEMQYGCITQNGRLVCGNRYK